MQVDIDMNKLAELERTASKASTEFAVALTALKDYVELALHKSGWNFHSPLPPEIEQIRKRGNPLER